MLVNNPPVSVTAYNVPFERGDAGDKSARRGAGDLEGRLSVLI